MSIDVDRIQGTDLFTILFEEDIHYDVDDVYVPDWYLEGDDVTLSHLVVAQGRNGLARAMAKFITEWMDFTSIREHSMPSSLAAIDEKDALMRKNLRDKEQEKTPEHLESYRQQNLEGFRSEIERLAHWRETVQFLEDAVKGRESEITWEEPVENIPFLEHPNYREGSYDDPMFTGGNPSHMGNVLVKALAEIQHAQFSYRFEVRPASIIS